MSMCVYVHVGACLSVYQPVGLHICGQSVSACTFGAYGVATISRLLKITGLFSQKGPIKETIFCKRNL